MGRRTGGRRANAMTQTYVEKVAGTSEPNGECPILDTRRIYWAGNSTDMISPTRRGHARRPPASQLAGASGQGSFCAAREMREVLGYRAFASTRAGVLCLQTHQMDLAGYANEACIGNANCVGRKLALWEAGAVSNSGGPPVGASKTQQAGIAREFLGTGFENLWNSGNFRAIGKSTR